MKIELVMQYNDAYAEMGDIAAARAAQYADRHRYTFGVSREIWGPCPFWSKVKLLREKAFPLVDQYTFWLDADTLILDLDYPLTNLMSGCAVDVSQDGNGLCTGVFGIQNTIKAKRLLDAWLCLGQVANPLRFGDGNLHE